MAYRTTYNFRAILSAETIHHLSSALPCIDFTNTSQITFKEEHTDPRLQDTLSRVVNCKFVQRDGVPELRISANYAVTYELVDRLEFACARMNESEFGFLIIGEHFKDNKKLGSLFVGKLVRQIESPKDWDTEFLFDRDDS